MEIPKWVEFFVLRYKAIKVSCELKPVKALLTSQDFADFMEGSILSRLLIRTKARELLPTDIWPV